MASKIDVLRKKITKATTLLLMNKSQNHADFDPNIKKILISRPNHRLGNQLLMLPLVKELENKFPEAELYLFTKGTLSKVIFKEFSSVKGHFNLPKKHYSELFSYLKVWFQLAFTRFDLCVNTEINSSSGRLSCILPKSKYVINHEYNPDEFGIDAYKFKHIAIQPILRFRMFFKLKNQINEDIPKLNIKTTLQEKKRGKEIIQQTKKRTDLKTICIFTNATGQKKYSSEWWFEFLKPFEESTVEYEIIELLPVENISQVNFKFPTIYSTDIREMAGIIENVDCFITADCGVMHLSSATSTPTVGLFKFMNIDNYRPYGGKNFAIQTKNLSPKEVFQKFIELTNFIKL